MHETKDSFRELVETIVFVVVLVLLLKSFVAEAFVIPTGSMAETLLGYQKYVTCPECKFEFPVNCSSEVDPQQADQRAPVVAATCPNCRKHIVFADEDMNPPWYTGDRVLVAKFLYDLKLLGMDHPNRYDVVVFKYPKEPQQNYVATNYIKRLIGLPGETIGIHYGKLYRYNRDDLNYPEDEGRDLDKWRKQYMHEDDRNAVELFRQDETLEPRDRKWKILRKGPDKILAEKRIVYDNDHPATDLSARTPPRWQAAADSLWAANDPKEPRRFEFSASGQNSGAVSWLRYKHLIPTSDRRGAHAELITDFMGYNTWEPPSDRPGHRPPPENWVGDLLLECEVKIEAPQGEFLMELSRGVDRFRAVWDLSTGACTLVRVADGKQEKLDTKPTLMKKEGTYRVRFGNIDDRLIVWVDSSLPFGDGWFYDAPRQLGPTAANDLEPASIGAEGAHLSVSSLKLWRDTYYTVNVAGPDAGVAVDFGQPDSWEPLRQLPAKTLYVQPGHYLCLGDNSPESSDGRSWGLVPERLLLGRALLVYWPHWRASLIH